METNQSLKTQKTLAFTGLVFTAISLITYLSPEFTSIKEKDYFGLFIINYVLAILFYLIRIFKMEKRLRNPFKSETISGHFNISLILWLISAFSLNREISIFEKSEVWLSIFLIIQCISLAAFSFAAKLPQILKLIMHFINGSGIIIFLYFTFYLFPHYAIGIIGAVFFGISLHLFVPFVFFINSIFIALKGRNENKKTIYATITGALAMLICFTYFTYQWNSTKEIINHTYNKNLVKSHDLPNWVIVSQSLPANKITEKILKTNLVYTTPNFSDNWLWRMPTRGFHEVKKHDPFVVMAAIISGTPQLDTEEKIKVLESVFDSRHQTEERLWDDSDLETSHVISNIELFPEHHLAYTEKILSIRNNHPYSSQQEAVYTFQLPEGSAVTSLSLWINGVEEKGYLTSKEKADTAYRTIVGRERRDPSVIHWKEGNRVSVRVFPCSPEEIRRFKIGITSPMALENGNLIYKNINFEGPPTKNALENLFVKTNSIEPADFPFNIEKENDNLYTADRNYSPDWQLNIKDPGLKNSSFTFNQKSYKLEPFQKTYNQANFQEYYLDINSSWNIQELNQLFELLKDKQVFVFKDELITLTEENMDALFKKLNKQTFSLFPIYKIKNPENAILITKGCENSPNLNELKNCKWAEKTIEFQQEEKRIKVYNLNNILSPYLRTLKELRTFDFDSGDLIKLKELITTNRCIIDQENDSTVVIDEAGIKIIETLLPLPSAQNAPDHLLRLFAYNDIMKKVSKTYYSNDYVNEELVKEAQMAYVVSPVSSLIVLETQNDYDRFGIKDSENSLKNASLNSSGAVPEPHEWMLIIISVLTALYFIAQPKLKHKI